MGTTYPNSKLEKAKKIFSVCNSVIQEFRSKKFTLRKQYYKFIYKHFVNKSQRLTNTTMSFNWD